MWSSTTKTRCPVSIATTTPRCTSLRYGQRGILPTRWLREHGRDRAKLAGLVEERRGAEHHAAPSIGERVRDHEDGDRLRGELRDEIEPAAVGQIDVEHDRVHHV